MFYVDDIVIFGATCTVEKLYFINFRRTYYFMLSYVLLSYVLRDHAHNIVLFLDWKYIYFNF